MISFKNKRKKYFLSKIIIGSFISVLCFILTCAVTVQGISPDVIGPDGLPEGYFGYFADTFWDGTMRIQRANDTWTGIGTLSNWSDGLLFSESVNPYLFETVNTFSLYSTLDKYRVWTVNNTITASTSLSIQNTHFKAIFTNEVTIPAGMQMEFWVKVNYLRILGYPQSSASGTDTSGGRQRWEVFRFDYALDDRWYKGDKDESSYVVFDHYTDLINGDWVCYRSDTSDIDRTIAGISLVPPVGDWPFIYNAILQCEFYLSPVIVGNLNSYQDPNLPSDPIDPPVTNDPIQDKLDDIINGSSDMDPDVTTPNYNEITPNPDYDVGGLVGEDDAISNLENMQGAANDLVGSSSFVQASNFWQDVFAKIFNLAGASVMASISGAIIVIRAVIGR